MIQEAIYGRRQVGRCIEAENSDLAEDPRYLGCHADVLGLLDAKCSGKKQCELRIPDPDLDQATSCVKSLRMFLEVRYTCVEGTCVTVCDKIVVTVTCAVRSRHCFSGVCMRVGQDCLSVFVSVCSSKN